MSRFFNENDALTVVVRMSNSKSRGQFWFLELLRLGLSTFESRNFRSAIFFQPNRIGRIVLGNGSFGMCS